MLQTNADAYFKEGCGRCDRFQTPDCKVHRWAEPLKALRALMLETDLVEDMKWGSPCYTLEGKNVVMLTSFNDYCALSFFKGAALKDEGGLLESPGESSRFVRFLKFTSLAEVKKHKKDALRFIEEATELERSGVKVEAPPASEPMPEELEKRLNGDAKLKKAFFALTPGRQRSHILYVSGAKGSEARVRRAEKCAEKIFAGKGFNER